MIDGQCSAICFGVADVALFIVDPITVVPAYLVITNERQPKTSAALLNVPASL